MNEPYDAHSGVAEVKDRPPTVPSKAKERSIVFSGESVRAILAGRKTQTRRIIKPQPKSVRWQSVICGKNYGWVDEHGKRIPRQFSLDTLWVRETWFEIYDRDTVKPTGKTLYAATYEGETYKMDEDGGIAYCKNGMEKSPWMSPLRMPRWASRITLRIMDVRTQRLQDMDENDAIAEGFEGGPNTTPREQYELAWDELNALKGYPWIDNPWVFAISFRRVTP